jgi:nicotinate-nucleotide adenylyltransferase
MIRRIKTGCLFGSFNPIHNGHLMVAQFMATQTDLEVVELVVSPQNPLKDTGWLADERHRLAMAKLAVQENPILKVNDIEFGLSRPSYTINTLTELSSKYPNREFILIMGSDSLAGLKQWKDWEQILDNFRCYVYLRPDNDPGELSTYPGVEIFSAPSIHLSSTFIRDSLAFAYSTKYLIPDNVRAYIEEHKIYVRN